MKHSYCLALVLALCGASFAASPVPRLNIDALISPFPQQQNFPATSITSTLSDNGTTLTYTGSIVAFPAGAAATPSLTSTDATTGFSRQAANIFGFSSNGVGVFIMGGQGLRLNGAAAVYQYGSAYGTAADTGVSRDAAAVVDIGSGAVGNTSGRLKAAAFMSVGTTATSNAGCGEGALTGGATAGKITTAGTTSCTTVITMGNTATSPNGWDCHVVDLTTAGDANNPHQSASNGTTATIVSGTIVASDVLSFSCIGY